MHNRFAYTTWTTLGIITLLTQLGEQMGHSIYDSQFTLTIKEGEKQMGQSSYGAGRALLWASPHQVFSIGWREAGAGHAFQPATLWSPPNAGQGHYLESSFPNWIKSIFSSSLLSNFSTQLIV
jgi:hypothetical protein